MGRNSKLTAGITGNRKYFSLENGSIKKKWKNRGNRKYFSLENGSIKKKWKNRVPIALIYPNIYSLGMSNLGFQLV
jgi:hypothetical protein